MAKSGRREIVLFDNYDVSQAYNSAEEYLKETFIDSETGKPSYTENDVWAQVSEQENFDWEYMKNEIAPLLASQVILTGYSGTWRGQMKGGRVLYSGNLPAWSKGDLLTYILGTVCEDCVYFRISVKCGVVHIKCTHHDGNCYELRNLSERGMRAFSDWEHGLRFGKLSEEEMHDRIVNSRVFVEKLDFVA